ncbi:hypothetical protein OG21DRAFT_1410043 [Imleria badia]|nr:hypothetical protein OG21DRAFT_1410043 [Imleria badia]
MLAAHLLHTQRDLDLPINIFVDNQATIKSGDIFTTKPGHYLINSLHRIIQAICKKHQCNKKDITLHWIAGHSDIPGNTKADEEAKKAATDKAHSSHRK